MFELKKTDIKWSALGSDRYSKFLLIGKNMNYDFILNYFKN